MGKVDAFKTWLLDFQRLHSLVLFDDNKNMLSTKSEFCFANAIVSCFPHWVSGPIYSLESVPKFYQSFPEIVYLLN